MAALPPSWVTCPTCGKRAGYPCVTKQGDPRKTPHQSRVEAGRQK